MTLFIALSVYNEELSLRRFVDTVLDVMNHCDVDYEIIFVNDGSIDRSSHILDIIATKNPKIKVVELARNFGHEAAMIAGIDYSSGDYIICMDADL